jgi:hypothetical protein
MINSVPIYKLSGVTQYTVMGNLTGQPAGRSLSVTSCIPAIN